MQLSEGYVTTEDGVRLYFRKLGDGPNAVLIPNAAFLFDPFQHLAAGRTAIFYDLRNGGRSDSVTDGSKLERGVLQDADDLEAVRRHFGIEKAAVIGYSFLGLVVMLHAMKYPAHVSRVVQIGAIQPNHATKYPEHLTGVDGVFREISAKLAELEEQRKTVDPQAFMKKWWSLMRVLYVADPTDADKVTRPSYFTEESFPRVMKHWAEYTFPSIQRLNLTAEDFAKVQAPVLTIHGVKDRQSPYGGGREWAMRLPNARLVTIENAAHMPWIEAPETVFGSISTFLDGAWPDAAEVVKSLDPCQVPRMVGK